MVIALKLSRINRLSQR